MTTTDTTHAPHPQAEVEAEIQRAEREIADMQRRLRERAIRGREQGYFRTDAQLNEVLRRLGLPELDATPQTYRLPITVEFALTVTGDAQTSQRLQALSSMIQANTDVVNATLSQALTAQLRQSAPDHAHEVQVNGVLTRVFDMRQDQRGR